MSLNAQLRANRPPASSLRKFFLGLWMVASCGIIIVLPVYLMCSSAFSSVKGWWQHRSLSNYAEESVGNFDLITKQTNTMSLPPIVKGKYLVYYLNKLERDARKYDELIDRGSPKGLNTFEGIVSEKHDLPLGKNAMLLPGLGITEKSPFSEIKNIAIASPFLATNTSSTFQYYKASPLSGQRLSPNYAGSHDYGYFGLHVWIVEVPSRKVLAYRVFPADKHPDDYPVTKMYEWLESSRR